MIYTRVSRLHFSPASEKIFRLRGCLCRHITWRSVAVGAGSKPVRLQQCVYLSISGRFRTCPISTIISDNIRYVTAIPAKQGVLSGLCLFQRGRRENIWHRNRCSRHLPGKGNPSLPDEGSYPGPSFSYAFLPLHHDRRSWRKKSF